MKENRLNASPSPSEGRTALLLGLGMQGTAALHDLVHNSNATRILVADSRPDIGAALQSYQDDRVRGYHIDAGDRNQLTSLIHKADVVIEALPPQFALPVGKIAAELGVSLVSSMYYQNPGETDPKKIAHLRQEVHDLDQRARQTGATILTEFGMDPGIDLVLGARALSEFDQVDTFNSYGASFPDLDAADNPLRYKFTWSVGGVMRAYLRPGKIIADGRVVEIPADEIFAGNNRHILEVDGIDSPLECYANGDAEHYAELFGLEGTVRHMGRYACRLPGHCDFWEKMAKSGFLNDQPIDVAGTKVSPVQFVTDLLGSQSQFFLKPQEKDLSLIYIDVRGIRNGRQSRITYQLIDHRDLATGLTSMQRMVGFTMGLGARLMLEGKLNNPGHRLPMDVPYEYVVEELNRNAMRVSRQEWPLDQD